MQTTFLRYTKVLLIISTVRRNTYKNRSYNNVIILCVNRYRFGKFEKSFSLMDPIGLLSSISMFVLAGMPFGIFVRALPRQKTLQNRFLSLVWHSHRLGHWMVLATKELTVAISIKHAFSNIFTTFWPVEKNLLMRVCFTVWFEEVFFQEKIFFRKLNVEDEIFNRAGSTFIQLIILSICNLS